MRRYIPLSLVLVAATFSCGDNSTDQTIGVQKSADQSQDFPQFHAATSEWRLERYNSKANWDRSNNAFDVRIQRTSGKDWAVLLARSVSLKKGEPFQFGFRASSSGDKKLIVVLQKNTPPHTVYHKQRYRVTAAEDLFQFEVPSAALTDPNTKLSLMIGSDKKPFFMSDLRFQRPVVPMPPDEPTPPVVEPPAVEPPQVEPPAPRPEPPVAAGAIVLPIEVMGEAGHTETVEVDLGDEVGKTLAVQVHNVTYADKARLKINQGPWMSIWNTNNQIRVASPDKEYGGFGGGFKSVQFRVPSQEFVTGKNSITFELTQRKGPSSGYRVLKLNVLNQDNLPILGAENFAQDDPRTWAPVLKGAGDIAAGRELWFQAPLKDTSATCGDCHAADGRDLKYYNVSNKVLEIHGQLRGLSESESQQLASYIRSLPIDAPAEARIWNPPYQPGPGLDAKAPGHWAAGAGLDAVLRSDAEMMPYFIGDGSAAAIAQVVKLGEKLNVREMPIAVQFPDWLDWLPEVYPGDIWKNGNFEKGLAYERYKALRATLKNQPQLANGALMNAFDRFPDGVVKFIAPGFTGPGWTAEASNNRPILANLPAGISKEKAKFELSRWSATKMWELNQEFALQDKYRGNAAEARQWPSKRYTVFQLAGHYIADPNRRGPRTVTSAFAWESLTVGAYRSSIWYQLQMTLNPGNKAGDAVEPVDWAYNYQHLPLLAERSGVAEPLRYFQNMLKGYQQRNVGGNPRINGWNMREVSPWRLVANYKGDDRLHKLLNTYDSGLRGRLTAAFLGAFMDKVESYSVTNWPKTTDCTTVPGSSCNQISPNYALKNWAALEDARHVPQVNPNQDKVNQHNQPFAWLGSFDAVEADAMIRALPRFKAAGLPCEPLDRLARWSELFWPKGDFESYFCR